MSDPGVMNGNAQEGGGGEAIDSSCESPPPGPRVPLYNTSSTPIKNRTSLQSLFSTYTRFRHETINTLGKEMTAFFTGPMPVTDFLNTFLPEARIPAYCSSSTEFKKRSFNTVLRAQTELQAYAPFVTAMQKMVPNLLFVDTHARGDKKNGFGFEIKPDVCVYSTAPNGQNNPITKCDMATLDLHVEFKWHDSEDPFIVLERSDSREQSSFIHDSDNARDTLGQISAYAAAQLSAQHRTHAFSIYVMRDAARIIRWDREGAIVTEPIAYNDDSSLVRFLHLYSLAPPPLRGIDTTISPATEDEAVPARTRLNLPPDTPMFRTSIPRVNTPVERPVVTDSDAEPVDPERSNLTIIFPSPETLPSLPACRGTRACPAYDLEEDRVVFFKDSWRVSTPDIQPEGDIYATLNTLHVDHVPQCLACGDVDGWAEQKTQTLKHSEFSWACREGLSIVAHTHYRLVLDLVGKSLSTFSSSKELVQAIRDALIAHQQAYVAGILHRDISVGNIIIINGRGYLIDWDLAKSTAVEWPRRVSRTGTWQFLSAHLVEDSTTLHVVQDDMESAFWVLLWTVLMFSPSSLSLQARTTFIRGIFESKPGAESKRSVLVSQTILEPTLLPGRESLYKLLKALANVFKHFYHRPDEEELALMRHVEALKNRSTEMENILRAVPAFQHNESKMNLRDHDYLINLLSDHLELEWPPDDAAEEQQLIAADCFGAMSDKMVVMRSKHVLETVIEEESRRRKRRKRRRVQRDLGVAEPDLPADQYDALSDDSDATYHEETESDSGHSISDIFGSSLTTLPSSPSFAG